MKTLANKITIQALSRQYGRPKQAHAFYCVPDLLAAKRFYHEVFNLMAVAEDEDLGIVLMSDGSELFTIGLVESIGVASPLRAATLAQQLPAKLVAGLLQPGLKILGYRVGSEEELEVRRRYLQKEGISLDWQCNHGDLMKSLYFPSPGGPLINLHYAKAGAVANNAIFNNKPLEWV